MTTPLETALSYAQDGWPVFPCSPETKAPLVARGLYAASTDPATIKSWWGRNPDAMIGVPTGKRAGVWVLDIDKGDTVDGEAVLAELVAANTELPSTVVSQTPSGGRHILFRLPEGVEVRNRGRFAPGLDTRGEGGYIIAAGSVKDDGTFYEWAPTEATEPADAPQWLLDLVTKRQAEPTTTATSTYKSGGNDPYVDAAISRELSDLAATPKGARNNALNDAAFAIGQFVGAGAISDSEARSALEAIARQWDNFTLSRKTIDNGLSAGRRSPRAIPERDLDLAEINADMSRKGAEIAARLLKRPEAPTAEATINAVTEPAPLVRATPFEWIDPANLPLREFLYGTHLIRKYVSVTVSPGGLGKTSLTIAEALAMVTGRPLLGTKSPKPLNVWLFNAEDPRDEMERRIMGAAMHYNLRPKDLKGLFLDTGREQELVVVKDDRRTGVTVVVPVVEAVVAQIEANKIDVMVIDPFVSTHAVSENDNGAIDKVAKLWAKIADQTNCAIEIVHHVRKVDGRDVTVEDARGAVSLLAAARSARVLNRMTEDEANSAGLSAEERFSYFSVSRGKANLAAMSGHQEWRHLKSVPLLNGRLMSPQDHVGVVTEWAWPDKGALVQGVPQDKLEQIKTRIGNTAGKLSPQASDWAGKEVAFVMGWDIADKATKAKVQKMILAWVEQGVMEVVNRRCPIKRENKDFVQLPGQDLG